MSKVVEFELCLNSNRFCLVLEKEKEIEKAKPKTQLNPRSRPKSNPWRPNLSPRRPSSLPCGPHSAARVAFSPLGLPAPTAHQRCPALPAPACSPQRVAHAQPAPRASPADQRGPLVGPVVSPASPGRATARRDTRPGITPDFRPGRARQGHPAAL